MATVKRSAGQAGAQVEAEFTEAARDSDRALRKVGGPGTFRGVGREAEREADRMRRSFKTSSGTGIALFAGVGASIGSAAAGGVAALGQLGASAVTAGVQTAAGLEMAQISFTELLGSARQADKFMRRLASFAATTPFELPGLVNATRSLIGAGQSADEAMTTLKALGETSAALGLDQERFGRVMLAVTQIMNKGKVSAEELLQINEAGIPIQKLLADSMGITTAELLKQGEAGKLQADKVLPALFSQMQKDYGGSMAKQAKTLNGAWSTFKDTLNITMAEGLQPLLGWVATRLPAAGDILGGSIKAVTGFFRDDLGPELGRVKAAWEANGTAILGLVTTMAAGQGGMDQSKTAAQSLADALVVLTTALGDASRGGDQLARGLNITEETLSRWGRSIHDQGVVPANNFVREIGEAIGVNQLFGLVARDVTADLGELGITFGRTSAATRDNTTAAEGLTAATQAQKAAVDALNASLDQEKASELNVRQAKLNVEAAQKRLNELKTQGKTKSIEYRQAQLSLERAQLNLTTTTSDYNAKVARTAEAERNAASKSDALTGAQKRLDASTFAAGRELIRFGDAAQAAFAKIKPKKVKVTADYDTSAPKGFELLVEKGLVRARGGGVWGTGTTTSDSIPAWLSDQEHVVDAAAVRGAGGGSYARGHAALNAMRRSWRGFQGGGPVGSSIDWEATGARGFLARPPRFDANLVKSLDAATAGFARIAGQFAPTGGIGGMTGRGAASGRWPPCGPCSPVCRSSRGSGRVRSPPPATPATTAKTAPSTFPPEWMFSISFGGPTARRPGS